MYVQARSRHSPMLNQIKSHVIHEGTSSRIQRSPTDSEDTKLVEASAETLMHFSEIETMTVEYILAKANEIAEQFEEHLKKTLIQTLEEATTKTGQVVDGRGQKISNDHIYEMLSKINIDFETSRDGDLTILTAPAMATKLAELDREIKSNPELRKKFDSLMDKKRNEFREREINRNLAG